MSGPSSPRSAGGGSTGGGPAGSGPSDAGPSSQPAPQPGAASSSPPGGRGDFNIGEEYGTARKNLPPARIVAISLAAVAAIAAIYALTNRAHPLSSGTIDDVVSVEVPGQEMVMVAINVSLENQSAKPSFIHTIQAALETASGRFTDDASPAVDAQRYFEAFPDLKRHALDFLKPETRLDPAHKVSGTIVVSFPVSGEAFNARKSLTVTVAPYDEVPVVITK